MSNNDLRHLYFEWMCEIVHDVEPNRRPSYKKLLYHIFNVDFLWHLEFDENRAEDGMALRYRFGYENGYDRLTISSFLDDRPCSIFELILALAIRCEEQFMSDPHLGDRTEKWFWGMIDNLGLTSMDDRRFDPKYVANILVTFMARGYKRDGKGGLFTIKHPQPDIRGIQIWDQMCWYLDEIV